MKTFGDGSPSKTPLGLMAPLSEGELAELDAFLMSDAVSDETMLLDSLDGFLTAIVVGPRTLMPSQWLAHVWGPTPDDAPIFADAAQAHVLHNRH